MVAELVRAPYGELMARTRDRDACPGALQLHHAADGALARVRLPGGVISPAQLEALARAATEFGSPAMELTSRGNVQLRAITNTAAVAEIVATAGMLPSQTLERVRNSPDPLDPHLDAELRAALEQAREQAADLPRAPGAAR